MSTDETRVPQLPPRRPIRTSTRRPDPCPDGHLSRPVRDTNGRELGYLCLGCGRMIHRRGGHDLLELCALRYLENGTELGDACRTKLERILRRARRAAGVEEADDE